MSADEKRHEAFAKTKSLLQMCRHFCSMWGSIQIADYMHHIGRVDGAKFRKIILDLDGINLMFVILRLPLRRRESAPGLPQKVEEEDNDLRDLFAQVYSFLSTFCRDGSMDHKDMVCHIHYIV
jgi:hypothetical protein